MNAAYIPLPQAYYPQPAGCLRLSGDDRRAFLQRQTSNHINLLTPTRSLLTVLTSPTARILDVFILLDEGETITILTLPERGASTYRYLRSRIFFSDNVSLSDESSSCAQIDLIAPAAASAVEALGLRLPEEVNAVCSSEDGLRLVRLEPGFGLGYRLLLPVSAAGHVETILAAAGVERLSPETYETLRIERGLPAAGHELTEDYTPLESGLRMAISDNKGCYTGQEVIARQITYDKVTRLLCGLRLSAPAEPGAELLAADASPAGKLTSVTRSPRLGWIGLGIVKRQYQQPGIQLRSGETVAQVIELPFSV